MARHSLSSFALSYVLLSLAALSAAQTCWYPDGQTQAQSDIPCDPTAGASACCGPNAFCLADGLCYINGAISRGSCTDKNWGPACAQQCTDVNTDAGVVLQPCNPEQNTFVCNLFNNTCDSSYFTLGGSNTIVLRPNQVQDGNSQLRRINPTSTFAAQSSEPAASSDGFSTVDMIGVGVGIGTPLLAALAATIFIAVSQRKKIKTLKAENKLTKGDSGFASPSYTGAHFAMPGQTPTPAHDGFHYQPLTNARPQGHFQEFVVNELDARGEPQELGLSKHR